MGASVYELALLLTLKDAASGGLDRFENKLRATGKEGRATFQTFHDLREDLKKDLATAGVGITTLAMLKKGVTAAGDFESSMADLRLSIQEMGTDGQINIAKMNGEMNRLESLSLRLGNALPGTTQDFVQMLATLKQGGLSTETIINGTGEAVANLAVITHQIPKDLAEPFAQYAQQFQLTGEEATKLSDTLARLKFATGLNPQDLIEGSKFFQLRAGAPLGMTGLEGAEQSGRFLATLKRSGLEGGLGGREAAMFLGHIATQKKALAEVKKEFGVDIQIFDKKGKFLGIENVFAQVEKLRKLSPQAQMEALKKLGGEEGAGVGSAMMKAGVDGWRKVNAEIDKSSSSQQKLNEITATYNAKMEAVQGTFENLKATAFTPLLDQLKPLLDSTNSVVGGLQEFSKAHPALMETTGDLVALGAVQLTIVGGIKSMITAWRLWRIASAVSAGEGLLPALTRTRTEVARTGVELETTATKAGGLRGQLGALSTLKTVGLIVALEFTISKGIELYDVLKEAQRQKQEEAGVDVASLKALRSLQARSALAGVPVDPKIYASHAVTDFASINRGGEFVDAFRGDGFTNLLKKFGQWATFQPFNQYQDVGTFSPRLASSTIKERAPDLADPHIMLEFLKQVRSMQLPAEKAGNTQLATLQRKDLDTAIQLAFPQSYKQASEQLTAEWQNLITPTQQTAEGFKQLKDPLSQLPSGFSKAGSAATEFANRVNSLEFAVPSPVASPTPEPSPSPGVPKSAVGSIVERDGLVNVHRGNVITPASLSRRGAGDWLEDFKGLRRASEGRDRLNSADLLAIGEVNIQRKNDFKAEGGDSYGDFHYHAPPIVLQGSQAQDLKKVFGQMLAQHERQVESIVTRRLRIRRERA